MAFQHKNTRARVSALQVLYTSEIQGCPSTEVVDSDKFLLEDDAEFSEYAECLAKGVAEHLAEIDEKLESSSDNWSISRMSVVDRCILRLAVYELAFEQSVPVSVIINEAVELAKQFGGEDESPSFVNGVLGRIADSYPRPEQADDASAEAAEEGAQSEEAEEALETSEE